MELEGRTAFVTGGGSGLGRAACRELAARGAFVAVADVNDAAARDAAASIGDHAHPLAIDVSDEESVRDGVQQALERFGRLHMVINCAGIPDACLLAPPDGISSAAAAFRRVVEVNLVGTFYVMAHGAAHMLTNDPDANGQRGVIVNTASVAAFHGTKGQLGYSAAKAGVIGMMLPAARELAGKGIRVVTISPGVFETGITADLPKVRDRLLAMNLEPKRIGEPAEFAALVAHIIENGYLNATVIDLDAGIRLENPR